MSLEAVVGRQIGALARSGLPRTVSRVVRRQGFPYTAPGTPRGVDPLPAERRAGADYDTAWARTFPARSRVRDRSP